MAKTNEEARLQCMELCFGDMPNEMCYDWVMFNHGTYFAFPREAPEVNIEEKALKLLEKWGEVIVGTYRADFNVINMEKEMPEDHVYVATFECYEPSTRFGTVVVWEKPEDRYRMGMAGRMYREKDSAHPVVFATNRTQAKK